MQSIDPPSKLHATEFRGVMDEGKSKPLLVDAFTEDWSESREVVLKLREPGDVPVQHHGGTGLACELICATLARSLGLSVPDYAVVEVTEEFASAVGDVAVSKRLKRNLGVNFGSAYLEGCRTWNAERRTLGEALRQTTTDILEYDSALLNPDRTTANSNLLWDGESCYPIDHALALLVYGGADTSTDEPSNVRLLADEEIRAHISYSVLKWHAGDLDSLALRWSNLPMDEILDEMRAVLPSEWESTPGDYDEIFDFLRSREDDFDAIVAQLQRLLS